jgi:hydrogenase maturation protein HypF
MVRGIVQGVGFRPYVYSLATRRSLKGLVFNNADGVLIDVEGDSQSIEQFFQEIRLNPPPLAQIESVESSGRLDPVDFPDFRIAASASAARKTAPITADSATCPDCLRELFDPNDRRYRYPFINCVNCGPRFTIVEGIPYDRAQTTMRDFPMCADCRAEYENPADRRFHAEPVACPVCGPRLRLIRADGEPVNPADGEDLVGRARSLLSQGAIVAVKGLGGFHLACDALNGAAVEGLRGRKYREDKPFALMASLDIVREYCLVSPAEESLLLSARRPIVLLERKSDARIPQAIAPGSRTLGFVSPYTPLHHLLLDGLDRPLVMTSGNVSDEPICYQDGEAGTRLAGIADYFLLHDRRIHMRADDSVARVLNGRETVVRRARGYAPSPIKTSFQFANQILACGAELKNTFCLARGDVAFVSHHIGDLENLETLRSFTEGVEHYKRLFDLRPEIIAYDLHPEYLSTKYALAQESVAAGATGVGVQHHHAHIASCMADNGVEGEVIGVAMDGLGFGEDGRFWGGEFFVADFARAERLAWLDYVPMPGGAKAIREPWRMAAVYLQRAFGDDFLNLDLPFVHNLDRRAWGALRQMMAKGTNCPQTSSMGRLFDAISSLLGVRTHIRYEGQAAIELEAIADRGASAGYEFEVTADGRIKSEALIRRAVDDLLNDQPAAEVSAKFHWAVVRLVVDVARQIRGSRGPRRVALSGGVFQNAFLLERVCQRLREEDFVVFTHGRVPTNDGGISLGQAAVANARLNSRRS